ncbi:MAG: PQQ-binding-like beta-propeller repeat protein [Verrucomicrobiae bacterium]|nr:PQQ-binding-like beta-propeller repeat protein [Verrucomicrobiae bacterium]
MMRSDAWLMMALCLFAAGASRPLAQDWPAWGGPLPGRNMYSPAKNLPASFEPGQYKTGTEEVDMATTKNVRWVVRLGSQAYGNPVVSGGRVFVGTNNEFPRNPVHQGDRSILLALEEKTGAFLWQLVIPKLEAGKVSDWEGLGLLSSPTVESNRIYLVTTRCEVMCLTTEGLRAGNTGPFTNEGQYFAGPMRPPTPVGGQDADIVWIYDMRDELGVFPHNAANCSVLLLGDYLYVCTSNAKDWNKLFVVSPKSPSLIVLDKRTGRLVAEDREQIGYRLYHSQWSSPSAGLVQGQWQVFFAAGDGFLYGFDARPLQDAQGSGLRKLWAVDGNPPEYKERNGQPVKYPDPEGPSEFCATPIFHDGKVYVATGQDPENGEGVGRLICVDARTGKLVWDFKEIQRSLSTASLDPDTGLLFIADFSGFLYCLESATGKLVWKHDMKAHVWGSTLVADGKVYLGDEDGDLVILSATREKKILHETNLHAPIYSTPIVANGVLYIGSQTHLYAIQASAP